MVKRVRNVGPLADADRFSVYAPGGQGERWRKYCLKHGVTFSEMAATFIEYGIEHLEPPAHATLRLPTGRRVRVKV